LDAARALGAAIPLVWDGFFYTVIISEFNAEYKKPWWIPFSLRCIVVSDPIAELAALAAPVANLIGNDVASAVSFGGQAGISLGGLSAAGIAGFAVAQTSITAGISNGGTALNTSVNALSNAPDSTTGVAAVNQMAATSSQLAALTCVSGYVNRAAANITNGLP
jgi:hypothetical protein